MVRALVVSLAGIAALVVGATATAGGPSPGVMLGAPGIAVAGGAHVIATPSEAGTTLVSLVRDRDGKRLRARMLPGKLGIPMVTIPGAVEGTSSNGRRLVLASSIYDGAPTTFVTLDTGTLEPLRTVTLRGAYAYDAVSPRGNRLYVVHYPGFQLGAGGSIHYVVRSLNLGTGRLDPGAIVDKRAGGAEMSGLPLSRAWSRDRVWAYTLYSRSESFAFVHALNTASRRAQCLALPWRGNAQQGLETVRMSVGRDGTLRLTQPGVGVLARIDTRAFEVSVVRGPIARPAS